MNSIVIVLACVLVAVTAQSAQSGRYFPDQYNGANQYNRYNNQYNRYNNQYNPYNNQYNRYQPYQNKPFQPYQPFQTSTLFPRLPVSTVAPLLPSVTPAPTSSGESASVAPAPVAPVVPALQVARVASSDALAETVRYGNEINPDGTFNYFYETNNGIAAQAEGVPRLFGGEPPVAPVVHQGAFSWTSPENRVVSITYTADENGYQPIGDAIPTSPPVPEQILRALDYIARNAPLSTTK